MKFQSRKDGFFTVVVFAVCALLLGIGISGWLKAEAEGHSFWPFIVIALVMGLLLWFFYGTDYEIREGRLYYKTGPIRGSVAVSEIREIAKGETQWVGLKVATARNGLILKYNKYDEIYISPDTNDSFIESMLALNPDIVITEGPLNNQ